MKPTPLLKKFPTFCLFPEKTRQRERTQMRF
uniref:Uncharacterized protein n=1 Tax=Rhizophora mucronata TaxID=61149 RepID=A0A2P2N8P7_RHIMU